MSITLDTQASALLALQALHTGSSESPATPGAGQTALTSASPGADAYTVSTPSFSPSTAQQVASGLAQGAALSDAASAAARSVGSLLKQLQQTASTAAQSSSSAASSDLDGQFSSLVAQIQNLVKSAGVGGQNLVDGSLSGSLSFATGADGSSAQLSPQDFSLGGPIISIDADTSISTQTSAASALGAVNQSLDAVGSAITSLDGQGDQIGASLASSQAGAASGTGAATSSDDSIRLLALQVQQTLSAQPTAIANQSSQSILSLFRS